MRNTTRISLFSAVAIGLICATPAQAGEWNDWAANVAKSVGVEDDNLKLGTRTISRPDGVHGGRSGPITVGRGVILDLVSVRATRIRFRDAAEAAFIAGLFEKKARREKSEVFIERIGNELVLIEGPRLADDRYVEAVRKASWETLPMPMGERQVKDMRFGRLDRIPELKLPKPIKMMPVSKAGLLGKLEKAMTPELKEVDSRHTLPDPAPMTRAKPIGGSSVSERGKNAPKARARPVARRRAATRRTRPAVAIGGSVGEGGKNEPQDVKAVAAELTERGFLASADAPLPEVISAIKAFQIEEAGFVTPDGRVDVNQRTLRTLNK